MSVGSVFSDFNAMFSYYRQGYQVLSFNFAISKPLFEKTKSCKNVSTEEAAKRPPTLESRYPLEWEDSFVGPPLANLRLWDYRGKFLDYGITPCLKLGLQKSTEAWWCSFGDHFGHHFVDHFGDDLRSDLWSDVRSDLRICTTKLPYFHYPTEELTRWSAKPGLGLISSH